MRTSLRAARTIIAALLLFVASAAVVLATAMPLPGRDFPTLSGRVVDEAGVIPAETQTALTEKLADLETKSGIQLVVATVKSLNGDDIADYANRLFRDWKLGEAKNNNGVLLLVAPSEHKARIEVGYGLEGTLTDAMSSVIIANAMVPKFKTGDYAAGIARGVDDIIATLSTDSAEWGMRPRVRADNRSHWLESLPFTLFVITFLIAMYLQRHAGAPGRRYGRIGGGPIFIPMSTGSSGWSGSGGGLSDSGGFSGGGGSSGGGGASGSW